MATVEELEQEYKEMRAEMAVDEVDAEMAAGKAKAERDYKELQAENHNFFRNKDKAWHLKPPITIETGAWPYTSTILLAEACLDCWGLGMFTRAFILSGAIEHQPCEACLGSGYRLTAAGAAIKALGAVTR